MEAKILTIFVNLIYNAIFAFQYSIGCNPNPHPVEYLTHGKNTRSVAKAASKTNREGMIVLHGIISVCITIALIYFKFSYFAQFAFAGLWLLTSISMIAYEKKFRRNNP